MSDFSPEQERMQLIMEKFCGLIDSSNSDPQDYVQWALHPRAKGHMVMKIDEAPFYEEIQDDHFQRFDGLLQLVLNGYGWHAENIDYRHYDVFPLGPRRRRT